MCASSVWLALSFLASLSRVFRMCEDGMGHSLVLEYLRGVMMAWPKDMDGRRRVNSQCQWADGQKAVSPSTAFSLG